MKILKELLLEIRGIEIYGESNVRLEGVELDSRKVKQGYLFVAIKGTNQDGHQFIDQAINDGAVAILSDNLPQELHPEVCYVVSSQIRETLGHIAANFYERPSQKLILVGVTGTNGKTSVATLSYNLFKEMGFKVGLISTIEILVNNEKYPSVLTTPDIVSLNKLLNEMVEKGCEYVFMEVSSHAAHQRRIAGLNFKVGVFTNITHDHLDYHHSFKEYILAKKLFFDHLSNKSIALINKDDKNGAVMVEHTKSKVKYYSLCRMADYKGKLLTEDAYGMQLNFNGANFMTQITGRFNAYNLLAVFAIARELLSVNEIDILERISALKSAKGRMEIVATSPRVVVDYAHTPDALQNVLKTLGESIGNGKLICVSGCGGDRDKAKRPLMAKVIIKHADIAILTSDNPRSEDPVQIIKDMIQNLDVSDQKKLIQIVDREHAIKTALMLSNSNDTVLIAGKGHEEYQEIEGKKIFFSDQKIVKDILSEDI
jgi:UDP-N-acetylmuramoyl-L-alanyl-D-glutamate--2,6-diaminopimelate ligase